MSETWQNDAVKDLEKIKHLSDMAIITFSYEESATKYTRLLGELSEMAYKVEKLQQHANIGLQFIENTKK